MVNGDKSCDVHVTICGDGNDVDGCGNEWFSNDGDRCGK